MNTATSMTPTEIQSFLDEQAANELLPLARRDLYALAAELFADPETDNWPAGRSFVVTMTEGL